MGLGNPYLGDDGIGVAVANELASTLALESSYELTITEASVGGLRLMETIEGYDRAIIIDALEVPYPTPGRIHRWGLDDLIKISPTQHSASAHDTTFPTAISAGRSIGLSLPDQIIIYAIEAAWSDEFSDELSLPLQQAIPAVVERIMQDLEREPAAAELPPAGAAI
ncbi:MAG: hydrogenase maturation protease [Anaerolineales bacterium]|nr:hydrogenase maturation protease [Anaerolineales bacterium]